MALHAIYSVFPPPGGHNVNGGDPVSEKKMVKGDGRWSTLKIILRFPFDGRHQTVCLPHEKLDRRLANLDIMLTITRVPFQEFRKVVGKLRHASAILPPGLGLFSPINKFLKGLPSMIGIGSNSNARLNLTDFRVLLLDAAVTPTSVLQLVRRSPDFVGYTEACATGMGGFGFWEILPSKISVGIFLFRRILFVNYTPTLTRRGA